jgi:hypothetical protein
MTVAPMAFVPIAVVAVTILLGTATAGAQTEPPAVLPPVVVEAPPPVSASSQVLIPAEDFELRPQGRPAISDGIAWRF